ncbi:hypothetical protein MRX96_030350 [Rhipicephalus microplus]
MPSLVALRRLQTSWMPSLALRTRMYSSRMPSLALCEDVDIADAQPSTSREDARLSTSTTSSTIRARLEPRFVSAEASRERAAAVQESLRAVSATERKMSLMDQGDESDI